MYMGVSLAKKESPFPRIVATVDVTLRGHPQSDVQGCSRSLQMKPSRDIQG